MRGEITMARVIEVLSVYILFSITGCVVDRVNLVKSGQILVNIVAPEDLHVSAIDIYQESNQFIIEGKVENKFPYCSKEGGHADILVLNPNGIVLKKITIDYRFTIIGCMRGGSRVGFFKVRPTVVPPEGSMVRLIFYD